MFHEFTDLSSQTLRKCRGHKTTRFSPNRDTFIAYTFSAAEGIASAANDSPQRGAARRRKSEEWRPR